MPYKNLIKRRECSKLSMQKHRMENPNKTKENWTKYNHCEKRKEYLKLYNETHKDELIAYRKDYWNKNKDIISEKRRSEEYLVKMRIHNKNFNDRLTLEVLTHYCNGLPYCQCPKCNETNIKFLTIDHINNNGAEERRKLGYRGNGIAFYRWLKKHNYPEGYQVLCMNCNFGRQRNNGVCPHQMESD